MEERKNEKFEVYCNAAKISIGVHDFVLQIFHETVNGQVHVGNLTMSPQHAKALAMVLSQHINQYEQVFGPIPTTPDNEKIERLREEGIIIERNELK